MELQLSEQLHGQPLENVSTLDQPCLHAKIQPEQNFESNLKQIELKCVDQCHHIQQFDVTQLVKAPEGAVVQDAASTVRDDGSMVDVEVKFGAMSNRKRGRPPRASPVKPKKRQPPPSQRRKKDEEDVCFICFDGGSLVLCDRRGCPKAYHPSCIKRDEAFFRSRAKWNCGWHICSTCRKASYYVCYTCTYSLCKGCIKDADYLCVRGSKGLCAACMKTIMMMENSALQNQGTQVDFDDKTSWEYLFKVYWVCLKEKLNLTLDELTQAKNPWNGLSLNAPKGKCSVEVDRSSVMATNGESTGDVTASSIHKGPSSENSSGHAEANHAKRRKTKKLVEFLNKPNSLNIEKSCGGEGTSSHEAPKWATDILLEFVAFMKNGDTSKITSTEVQGLVLEYVKRYNLHDPDQECLVVCDARLYGLLGLERVRHLEMLGILETHLLDKENSLAHHTTIGVADGCASQMEIDAENDNQLTSENDKRLQTCKRAGKKGSVVDPNEYAAIDVHNINLIYLKRSFAENFIDESDKFQEKVVGSIVRIKITGTDPKQEMYRLVRVTGTGKAAEPYVIGDRKTDLMIEVRNLRKSDLLSIDAISNEEFSEDECKRLCQSIKCGLTKHFTVGEILERAIRLQPQRIDDLLEAQKLQLIHLRDQATEKGHKKELRECLEKLELLNSPDNHKRRLLGVEVVNIDPCIDRSYEFEDDVGEFVEKKSVNCVRPRNPKSVSEVASGNILPSTSVGIVQPAVIEAEKTWYYEDPNGKSQGPFSIAQLRKWNTSGHFPVTLRVWRTDQKQDDSMLLTDALNGGFYKTIKSRMNVGISCDEQVFSEGHAHKQALSEGSMVPTSVENCMLPHIHSASNGWDSNSSFAALLNSREIADQTPPDKSQLAKENRGCEMGPDGGETKSGQSFGQKSRSPPVDSSINAWDNTALVNFVKSFEFIDRNQEIDFSDLPHPTPNQSHVQGEDSEMKKPRCSTASGPVAGGPQLPDVAGEWSGYSSSPAKPSMGKGESDVVAASIVKQTEVPSDHAATPTSAPSDHSSSSHPASNAASWQPVDVAEIAEFTAWSEESVSELLAEVDEAMRSLNGVSSPTSPLHCGVENDCFSPLRGLSSRVDAGRSASLSSSSDRQIISQSPVNEEPRGVPQRDVLDPQKSSGGPSSTSNEVEVPEEVTKPSDDSVSQCKPASNLSPPLPPVTSWEMATIDTTWRPATETTNISEGAVEGNADLGFRGLFQGTMNDDWINGQWGNLAIWGSQPRYGGDRLSSPRDFNVDGMDSSFGSGRPVFNGQAMYDNGDGGGKTLFDDGNGGGKTMFDDGNGGGSFGFTPKGQQVCKFHETGWDIL